ncbi:MAG: ATP-dependent zinc metalloprotease FtsH [Planctomycetes bacterium]|nr:ATP-dependent zinc metalloprotease FtsH [Planctomycetota bacterium]
MQKTNTKPGSRLPRSYGSFILLTTLLLVLFVAFGKNPWAAEEAISQDEFRYLLYTGKLEKPRLQGDRFVIAEERVSEGGQTRRVRTSFADTKAIEVELRRAAKTVEKRYTQGDFLARFGSGDLTVLRAYPIKRFEAREGEKARAEESFFADVVDGGRLYAEVVSDTSGEALDLGGILKALKAKEVPVEPDLVFNGPQGVVYNEGNPVLLLVLVQFAPWIVIILLLYFFVVRQLRSPGGGGGVLSFGRSRATLYTKENRTNVTFEDVAGIDEAKEEVQEIIEFLKNPARFQRLGGRIPRGVLLVGPPGAGKTLLAKAIAGEAEVPFFSISGSDFVEMFVGVGASRVRDLFKQAKENSPCIVFLDEIDAVGRKRGTGLGGGHDEREQTLNAILVEMDGFGTDEGVIVIAATNRPDVLDPALLRPGRYDREIVIDLPDVKGREAILKVHARKVKMGGDVELSIVARSTPAFSGADLAAVINEAAILAAMRRKEQVGMEELEEARERVRFGRAKKSRVMEREDRLVVATHEAGHALVAALLPDAERPHKVTIIPRGMALGLTMKLPEKDRRTTTRKRMRAEISVAYGGRIAESLACEDISSGAHDDIRRATELARLMVCEWGMSDSIGPVHYGEKTGSDFLGQEFSFGRNHSEAQAEQIDREVRAILDACYEQAEALIKGHRAELDRMAEALLQYETLTGVEVTALIEGTVPDRLRPEAPRVESPAPAPKASAPSPVPSRGVLPGEEPGLAPA